MPDPVHYAEQWTTGDAVVYPEQWGGGTTVTEDYTLTTGDDGGTINGNPGAGETVGVIVPNSADSGFTGAGATITIGNNGSGDVEIRAGSKVVLNGRPPGKGKFNLPNGNAPVRVIEAAIDRWNLDDGAGGEADVEDISGRLGLDAISLMPICLTELGLYKP